MNRRQRLLQHHGLQMMGPTIKRLTLKVRLWLWLKIRQILLIIQIV